MTAYPAPFAIRVLADAVAAVRIHVSGELDLATAPELRNALSRELDAGNEVVLDLSGVTFIDSTGLHTIVSALGVSDNGRAALSVSPELPYQVRRVLEITGLDAVIPVASI